MSPKKSPAKRSVAVGPVKAKKATKREIASAASISVSNPEIAAKLQSRHAVKAAAGKPAPATDGTAPAGQKFCPYHQTTHPVADFASNKPAKDGLYYICRLAEKAKRDAAKVATTPTSAV